jgi:hypothetical protein
MLRPAARSRADAQAGGDPREPARPPSGGQGTGPARRGRRDRGKRLAAAEQKLTAMRDLAARDATVYLGTPDFRGVVERIDS